MDIKKRWPLIIVAIVGAATAVQHSGALVPGGTASTAISGILSVCAVILGIFGEKQTRGANPQDRATDPVIKAP